TGSDSIVAELLTAGSADYCNPAASRSTPRQCWPSGMTLHYRANSRADKVGMLPTQHDLGDLLGKALRCPQPVVGIGIQSNNSGTDRKRKRRLRLGSINPDQYIINRVRQCHYPQLLRLIIHDFGSAAACSAL